MPSAGDPCRRDGQGCCCIRTGLTLQLRVGERRLESGLAAREARLASAGNLASVGGLLDLVVLLGKDHLNVARRRHVRVDATVRAVRSPALHRRLVDLDVADDQRLRVQALRLRVRFSVLQQAQDEPAGLIRPASLRHAVLLRLRVTPDAAVEATERDDVLVRQDVVHVRLRLGQRHVLDGHGRLMRVLEVNAQVRAGRARRFLGRLRLERVLRHR